MVRAVLSVGAAVLLGALMSCAAPAGPEANAPIGAEYAMPVAPPRFAPLEQKLRAGLYGNQHSLLVFANNSPVAEYYFTGADEKRGYPLGVVAYDKDALHDVRSVSKSVTSLAFGIAMGEGKFASLDTPVLDYFPEYKDLQTPERRKIKLRDMLAMSSGLRWDEDTLPYSDPRNSERMMDAAPDRLRYVLSQPIAAPPGTKFQYSGGDVAVIAAILARATKTPLDVYAKRVLFTKLGIARYEWLKDDHGIPYAASGLRLRPRDMGKIGMLVANGGRVGDAQIVPADWITAATTPHAVVGGDDACGVRYGYFWWLGTACTPTAHTRWIAGIGYGGQRIWILPDMHVVVVSTAGLYADPKQSEFARAILAEATADYVAAALPPAKP